MLKIGITGGIGSGKSVVCKVFEQLGIPVFYADEEGKKILAGDPTVVAAVKQLLGPDVYDADGKPDRQKIAAAVFSNPDLLTKLNSIVHPAVFRRFDEWVREQKGVPYVIKEAAIMFESGSDKGLDKVITVYAPAGIRVRRVMERDGVTAEKVEKRMASQMSEEEKMKRADFVIHNDEQQMVLPQVLKLHLLFTGGH